MADAPLCVFYVKMLLLCLVQFIVRCFCSRNFIIRKFSPCFAIQFRFCWRKKIVCLHRTRERKMCNTASKMLYTSEIFMKLSGVLKINKGCVHRPTTTVNLRIEKMRKRISLRPELSCAHLAAIFDRVDVMSYWLLFNCERK